MYAIIRTGGKQYKVQPGDLVRVEKLESDLGSEISITDVLFLGGEEAQFDSTTLSAAKVDAVVTRQSRLPKIAVFKKKRRQGYRRMQGHRQAFTELFIKAITSSTGTVSAETEARVAGVSNPERAEDKKKTKSSAESSTAVKTKKKSKKATAKKAVGKKKATKKATKKAPKKTAKKSRASTT